MKVLRAFYPLGLLGDSVDASKGLLFQLAATWG